MAVTSYFTPARDGVAEIEVEKSRFLCTIARVPDEVEARGLVDSVRKQHWNAGHHCNAFVVGPDRSVEQANDDGEPPGTGGAPILGVLRGRELTDVVAVVSRAGSAA